ncbi:MAG: hypothetical protein HOP29_01015 [Phycisphaerales bacterium]|nr:hypothetical protein [Phycisphaerales bacterium]
MPSDVAVKFVGFDFKNVFVVRHGLDYNGQQRNRPRLALPQLERYAAQREREEELIT